MFGVIADHNTEGHLTRLLARLIASEFRAEWDRLQVHVETFPSLGLSTDTNDRHLWSICQSRGLVLVTANRNHESDDSLEAAIREGGPVTLPVLTYANADRVLVDSAYAELTALALLEIFVDLKDHPETILGCGRLYIPRTSR